MCYERCTTINSRTGKNHRSGRVVTAARLFANDVDGEDGSDLVLKAAGVNQPSRTVTHPAVFIIPNSRVTNRAIRRLYR